MRICMIAEGSYPYITGGVSSWINTLIRNMPMHEFVIYAIAPQEKFRGNFQYEIPSNVVEVVEVFLDSWMIEEVVRQRKLRFTHKQKETLKQLIIGEKFDWEYLFNLIESKKVTNVQDFLLSRDFFDIVYTAYEESYSQSPFTEFFWTMRSMLLPLFHIMKHDIPKADLYHVPSTGYAGIVGSLAKRKYNKPLLITEHGIYTREREIEIVKATWMQSYYKSMWIEFFYNLSRCSYDYADKVFTLFERNKDVEVSLGCDEQKISIIPNGVDYDGFAKLSNLDLNQKVEAQKNLDGIEVSQETDVENLEDNNKTLGNEIIHHASDEDLLNMLDESLDEKTLDAVYGVHESKHALSKTEQIFNQNKDSLSDVIEYKEPEIKFRLVDMGSHSDELEPDKKIEDYLQYYADDDAGFKLKPKKKRKSNVELSTKQIKKTKEDITQKVKREIPQIDDRYVSDIGDVSDKKLDEFDIVDDNPILEYDPNMYTVSAIVRVVPIKDIKTMLLAFDRVKKALPNTRFFIMGPIDEDSEYYHECLQTVKDLDLKDVVFTGKVNVKDYIPISDLFVLSSISEGQPLSVLETMASGKVNITTDVGSCKEVLYGERDRLGRCGIVVPIMDYIAIAKGVVKLLKDEELRTEMGIIAMQRVDKYYRREMMVGSYLDVYSDLYNIME